MMPVRLLLLVSAALLAAQPAGASVKHTVGIARDADSNAVRYIEHHQYLDDGQHVVRYYDTSNNMLLKKEMRYPGLPQHPTLVQSDYQTGAEIAIRNDENRATMVKPQGDDSKRFTFELTEDTVVDAGFDAYIRENWSAFADNQHQQVRFAVAGQSRLLDMTISRAGRQGELTRFTVEPANWFVRLLVPRITLHYDAQRQLKRYEGFSNLSPPGDGSRQVVIEFDHYSLDESLTKPRDEWLSAISGR